MVRYQIPTVAFIMLMDYILQAKEHQTTPEAYYQEHIRPIKQVQPSMTENKSASAQSRAKWVCNSN